ncbi:hypothetical protein DOTSEDRAFT_19556 [Dothistroma septosporum NZE10]|uniref:Uncharacterized protein n=1 Tax=Dothistroma septosporum (strain NZE10 / CBS 128990) TaxID=675120 RepID=N1Q005_DOTSN|nr:hypothetical protein DOTSEDRAFT_19556 [Dothistroma septosporum NZE10]
MGSADQSEDVAVVAIEDVDESPLSDLSGDKAVDGTLADGEAVAETNYVEQGDAPQKWRRASVKTSESAPSSQVPSEVRLRATASEPHGIARAEPGNASGRAREGPEVDNHNGKRTNTSHDTSRKLSKMSKSRADSKFSNIGLESTKERSRKLFPRSSTDLPRPRWAKDKEPRSPATFRSDTASLSSKRSAVLKEVASAKASSIGPQRGRRTSSNDLNKKYAAGEAVAPSTSDFSEAVTTGHGPSQEEVGVVSTNDEAKPTTSRTSGSRSHRSSRTGSAVIKAVAAADTVPGNEREPKNLGLADDTPKARSKATSRASEGSRSKRCPGSAEDGASDFGQSKDA